MINFKMPKGRQTIRKHGGRHTRLWELAGSSIPAVQRLEVVYLDGHGAMDRTEARHAANKADKRLTQDGVRDDLLKFVLNDVVPALHRGRTKIKRLFRKSCGCFWQLQSAGSMHVSTLSRRYS